MATPEQLSAQLVAIERSIASGALKVSYDGKSVEYRSITDLIMVRDDIKKALGLTPLPIRRTVAGYNGGF